MNRRLLFLAGALAGTSLFFTNLLPFSAGSSRALAAETATQADEHPSLNPLLGTKWRVIGYQPMDETIEKILPDDPAKYTMDLNNDGTVSMQLNCNTVTGTWTAQATRGGQKGTFSFKELDITKKLCPQPSIDKTVAKYITTVRGFDMKHNRLYFSLEGNEGTLEYEPNTELKVPGIPDDGGPRSWQAKDKNPPLSLLEAPNPLAAEIASLPGTTFFVNLGCQQKKDQVWCEVQPFSSDIRGYIALNLLTPGVSADGTAPTGGDDSAIRAGVKLFGATGTIPCRTAKADDEKQCKYGVAYAGGGYATVRITNPEGKPRFIYYSLGIPVGTDPAKTGEDVTFQASREGNDYLITIGQEKYEIPGDVPFEK